MSDAVTIRAGAIVDGSGSGPTLGQVIVVRDGWIEAIVGDDGAEPTIDFSEFTVVPGLVDAHLHLAFSTEPGWRFDDDNEDAIYTRACQQAAVLLASGVTSAADCGGPAQVMVRLRDEIESGRLPGPRLRVSGPFLTVAGAHGADSGGLVVAGAEDAVGSVAALAAAQVDFVKVMGTGGGGDGAADILFSEDELGAVVAEARRHGLRVAVHCHGVEGIRIALSAGADRIEHCTFFDGHSCQFDPELARALASAGILVCPTNAIDFRRLEAGGSSAPREMLNSVWRDLLDCGVTFAGGSDAGVFDMLFDDYALVPELMVTELGMSPIDALVSCTQRAAAAIGLASETGTLEPGRRADLIAVDGDPSVDVTALGRVNAVVRAGGIVARNGVARNKEVCW